MTYSPPAVNAVGYGMLGLAALGEGVVWVVAQASGPLPPGVAAQSGNNAFWLGLTGVTTLVINAIVADRKAKRDADNDKRFAELRVRSDADAAANERKVQDALATAERNVADALALANRKIADAKAESDRALARLQIDADAAAERRKAEREFSFKQMLELKDKLDRLTRADRRMEPKVDRNTVSADILSAGTNIPIPPAPEVDPDADHGPEPE